MSQNWVDDLSSTCFFVTMKAGSCELAASSTSVVRDICRNGSFAVRVGRFGVRALIAAQMRWTDKCVSGWWTNLTNFATQVSLFH